MAPEQELYEREERNRRRRPVAADWGVAEDIFDRMPSPRFQRSRAESQEIVIRRADTGAEAQWVDEGPAVVELREERADVWIEEPSQASDAWATEAPRRGVDVRVEPDSGRTVDSWMEPDTRPAAGDERQVESWLDDEARPLVRGESRTIVLSRLPEPTPEPDRERERAERPTPEGRRTIKISGHPDRLPVPRTPRPQRSAVERISMRPDHIAGYAVALGFLLVLIAVLTTGH
jgi:hypothetical protein